MLDYFVYMRYNYPDEYFFFISYISFCKDVWKAICK